MILAMALGFSASANRAELPGFVGSWNFDEGRGNVARDGSSTNHNGRIIGGPNT